MDNSFTIEVLCLFCNSALKVEKGKEHSSGDMIRCSACGELNDYDSALDVAKEKGIELARAEIERQIKLAFKK